MNPEEYRRLADLEATHWWYRGLHAAVFDLIDRYQGLLPPHPRILDAGCGTGFVSRRLAKRGEVIGIDFSEHAAAYWRPPPTFLRASVTALPFRDACFDLVVSLDVLYHRAVGDDAHAAAELSRVLRPGGLLILNLPAYEVLRSRHDRAIHTARRYTGARVRELMVGAGLTPRCLGHWNTLLFPLAVAARLWGRLRPSDAHGSDVQPAPPWQNALLSRVLDLELRLRRRWEMPFGLSVIAVGQKGAGVSPARRGEAACGRS